MFGNLSCGDFACLEFPFVAGSCWQRSGAIMFSSVLVAALLL